MKSWARCIVMLSLVWSGVARGADLTFGVFGDTPYSVLEELAFPDLITQMSAEPLAFIVHIGDFKSGSSPCTDELFLHRREQFQQSKHPLVFLPADNEWTDCHRMGAGRMDPLERLTKLRTLFSAGESSLGQRTMPLRRQSSDPRFRVYRENVRWSMGGVQFVAVNVTGSNNNFDRTSEMDDEVHARMAANEAWLAEAVGIAISERARALVLFFHANPMFERDGRPSSRRDGFLTWRALLAEAAVRFQGPLLIVHGDSHKHRIDHPLRIPKSEATFPKVMRLEVFGSPASNWSRVTISGDAPATFRIESGKKTEGGNP